MGAALLVVTRRRRVHDVVEGSLGRSLTTRFEDGHERGPARAVHQLHAVRQVVRARHFAG